MRIAKKLIKWGGSLGLTIPENIVDSLHLKDGDMVDIDINKIEEYNIFKKEIKCETPCEICETINFATQEDIENGFIECRACDNSISLIKFEGGKNGRRERECRNKGRSR